MLYFQILTSVRTRALVTPMLLVRTVQVITHVLVCMVILEMELTVLIKMNVMDTPCSTLVNCTNTVGSYVCSDCPSGYTGNGTVCNGMNIFPSVFLCLTDLFYTW